MPFRPQHTGDRGTILPFSRIASTTFFRGHSKPYGHRVYALKGAANRAQPAPEHPAQSASMTSLRAKYLTCPESDATPTPAENIFCRGVRMTQIRQRRKGLDEHDFHTVHDLEPLHRSGRPQCRRSRTRRWSRLSERLRRRSGPFVLGRRQFRATNHDVAWGLGRYAKSSRERRRRSESIHFVCGPEPTSGFSAA